MSCIDGDCGYCEECLEVLSKQPLIDEIERLTAENAALRQRLESAHVAKVASHVERDRLLATLGRYKTALREAAKVVAQ